MITVKLYGLIRIESGIREKRLEAGTVREALEALADCGLEKKDLMGCVMLINGKTANRKSKLADGDTLVLMSPVAGG